MTVRKLRAWFAAPDDRGAAAALLAELRDHMVAQFGRKVALAMLAGADTEAIAKAYLRVGRSGQIPYSGEPAATAPALLAKVWREHGTRLLAMAGASLRAEPEPAATTPATAPPAVPPELPPEVARPAPMRTRGETDGAVAPVAASARVDPPAPASGTGRVRVLLQPVDRTTDDADAAAATYQSRLGGGLPLAPIPDAAALTELAARFAWCSPAVAAVRTELDLARLLGAAHLPLPPIVLSGPPGIGKSRLARALADALGRACHVEPMAGVSDGFTIGGLPRSFRNAQPSLAVRAMAASHTADPLVVLDELDRVGSGDQNGDALTALLPWLERSTAARILDRFLLAEVDASHIAWVATVNDVTRLPAALLSRCQVIALGRPGAEHLDGVLATFRADLAVAYGVAEDAIPEPDELTRVRLARQLALTGDLRALERAWHAALTARPLRPVP